MTILCKAYVSQDLILPTQSVPAGPMPAVLWDLTDACNGVLCSYPTGTVCSRDMGGDGGAGGHRGGGRVAPLACACRVFDGIATLDEFSLPIPWPPGEQPKDDPRVQAIAQAARDLVEQRDRWLIATPTAHSPLGRGTFAKHARRVSPQSEVVKTAQQNESADLGEAGRGSKRTLTSLCNARPTWLDQAHGRFDEAVFGAYGWKSDLSDEEILEKLLALKLERARK